MVLSYSLFEGKFYLYLLIVEINYIYMNQVYRHRIPLLTSENYHQNQII